MRVRPWGMLGVGWSHPGALAADVPFARRPSRERGDWELYLPGSTLKGALRSAASRVAAAYGFTTCSAVKPELIVEAHGEEPCDVCYLFGMPGPHHPRLIVSDLTPREPVEPSLTTRVRIEDRSLRADEGGLYAVEMVDRRAEFAGELYYREVDGKRLGLLLLALAELRLGRVGRRSLVDLKLERPDQLLGDVEERWRALARELGEWLWTGFSR